MQTIKAVERELAEHRAIANATNLGPTRDNSGKIVHTAEERRYFARRAVTRLETELANLRKVVGI